MLFHMLAKTLLALPILPFLSSHLSYMQEPPTAAAQPKVFVFFQRTDAHAKYSKSEVFHNARNDILAFLKEKNVAIAVDEFGGRSYAENPTPLDTVFKIAHDTDATSVLYIVIDRPASKWIKITAQSFDMNGRLLWKEEASNGSSLSGEGGLNSTEKRIRERLSHHVGKEGMPVSATAQASSRSE